MPYTILIIDDQWSMQELARIVLQAEGYRVMLAGDAATGLSMARLERPNVIILDSAIPEKDGCDVVRSLREDPGTANIPVILVEPKRSGKRANERAERPEPCLCKPFPATALIRLVDRTLNQGPVRIAV